VQTLYTAATGMQARQTKLDVIGNNMANVNTTAFKKDRANFEDLFYDNQVMPGNLDSTDTPTPTGTNIGLGVKVSSVQSDFSNGGVNTTNRPLDMIITNRPLDMMIDGPGFFQIEDPSGDILYTRAGNFSRNSNGDLVMGSASLDHKLSPPINIPFGARNPQVSPDGKITYQLAGDTVAGPTIVLANFINPEGLLKMGENLYSETQASGAAATGAPRLEGMGGIQGGALEASNVEPVKELIDLITTQRKELIDLITTQRSFEMNSQTIKAGDEMLQLTSILGR
ncbi:MAG: flagellar basal-body rod protein FlgG, partial [Blastopirellula sp.]